VKSLAGIPLQRAMLSFEGFGNDRRFMLVTETGQFVTQERVPDLALIRTALVDDRVVLSRDGHGEIAVQLQDEAGRPVRTRVWRDECQALDCGDTVAEWLTDAAGGTRPLRLVRMKPGFSRQQSDIERFGAGHSTAFTDAAPLLVANAGSLDALNHELLARGQSAVPMDRFRPNVVLRGIPAFSEHANATLVADGITIRLCTPCERCVVTTIDQATAVRDPARQPFVTLRDINPMPGKPRAPAFGQYAVLEHGNGQWLARGDNLTFKKVNP
jgi:uncharacterized protein YcbX